MWWRHVCNGTHVWVIKIKAMGKCQSHKTKYWLNDAMWYRCDLLTKLYLITVHLVHWGMVRIVQFCYVWWSGRCCLCPKENDISVTWEINILWPLMEIPIDSHIRSEIIARSPIQGLNKTPMICHWSNIDRAREPCQGTGTPKAKLYV